VPFQVIWFEDATAAARALGVDIELPDLGITDREYWARFDRKAWRERLRGRVVMSEEDFARGDPDWVRLAVFPAMGQANKPIELWFDLEDGIVFRCTAATLADVAALVRAAAARAGLTLSDEWPGCVSAMQTRAGAGIPGDEELRPLLEAAGFEREGSGWRLAVARRVH
jgi:hypothetical protein